MFTYNAQDLISKAGAVLNLCSDQNALGTFDVLVEQFQEAVTTEQYLQCFKEHMFDNPWSKTIYPDFDQYQQTGSTDPIKIILPNGDVIKCRVLF